MSITKPNPGAEGSPSSASKVAILSWNVATSSERNAAKIAEFLGAEVTKISLEDAGSPEWILHQVSSCIAVIVDIETLARIADELQEGTNGLVELVNSVPYLFIYGRKPSERHTSIVQALSFGTLAGFASLPAKANFEVSDDSRKWCGPFSGLTVSGVDESGEGCFVEGSQDSRRTVLVRAAGEPFFVRIDRAASEIFLVACDNLGDIDERVYGQTSLVPWFSRLVPLMIFLKAALKDGVWHSRCSQACFIIDDPLLKPRYGFLDYSKLLESLKRYGFCTSVAFIPWNYRRSRKRVAAFFGVEPNSLSLCVHGCDHTGGEFAATAPSLLLAKARLALDRMRRHSELSGASFDEVMVFPQGLFSMEALQALDDCGYLAAVNTDLNPSDQPQELTLRDLMSVAVTTGNGFPLFGRHYPRDVADFAFDLFVGKPAFVVEHHGYFRNGYEALGDFVKLLNGLDDEIKWSNLASSCSQASLERATADGTVHIRFYTSRFCLNNEGAQHQDYLLFRPRTSERPLPRVTVNGCSWAPEQHPESLGIRLSLGPGESADIHVLPDHPKCDVSWRPSYSYSAKVLVRRLLCEIRDNYVDTNAFLSKVAAVSRFLRKTITGTPGIPALD